MFEKSSQKNSGSKGSVSVKTNLFEKKSSSKSMRHEVRHDGSFSLSLFSLSPSFSC